MANLSKDIQCASSDTRPPMLDRTDFASWKQCIQLETLTEGTEGALHLGPERPRVYSDLTFKEKDMYNADIRATNILLQGSETEQRIEGLQLRLVVCLSEAARGTKPQFKTTGLSFRMFRVDRIEDKGTMHGVQAQLVIGELRTELGMLIHVKQEYFKDKMLLMQAQKNGVELNKEQLLFIAADDCDAFDSDVDEALTAKNLFMANLSSADPVYDEAVHEMHDDVQPNYVVDSHTDYTSDSNMIPYDQYVKDNAMQVVQRQKLTEKVSVLQEQNELFRAENAKVKQHYKELYKSIKIMRAKHINQTTALLTENENLKVQINVKLKYVTIDSVTPKVLAPGMYAIDVELIPLRLRNNREVHLDYLKHLKKSVATLRNIVEEAKVERQLDRLIASACLYTKHSQELLEYGILCGRTGTQSVFYRAFLRF
nr:hypothetical protein [Tanacetum cinerariifolium]